MSVFFRHSHNNNKVYDVRMNTISQMQTTSLRSFKVSSSISETATSRHSLV